MNKIEREGALGGESRAKFDHFDDIYNSLLNVEPVAVQVVSNPQSRVVIKGWTGSGLYQRMLLYLFRFYYLLNDVGNFLPKV